MKRFLLSAFTVAATVVFIFGSGKARSQDKKEVNRTIIISNGDTIVNGQKLSEATAAERKMLLKEFGESKKMRANKTVTQPGRGAKEEREIRIGGPAPKFRSYGKGFVYKDGDSAQSLFRIETDSLRVFFKNDSIDTEFRFELNDPESNLRRKVITMNRSLAGVPDMAEGIYPRLFMSGPEGLGMPGFARDNSQRFSYVSTDKDGISSRMNISISQPTVDELKKMDVSETGASSLVVNDLTLSPNFSSGKLNLSFSLPGKGSTDVKISDSDMKTIFSDKTDVNEIYFKQISLPKNGLYYLTVSQGGKTIVRKMIKN